MILQVFCVFDVKAEAFMQPFFMNTKGEAIRAFSDMSNNPETMFSKHPLDFTLMHIGSFNDNNGALEKLMAPEPIGSAQEFKRVQPSQE